MKEYLATLFGVCLLSAIVRAITPESATKKYIEILCSLCVVAAIVLPIIKQISDYNGVDGLFEEIDYESYDYEEIYNSYIMDENIKMAQETLACELENKFGTDSGSIGVRLITEIIDGEIKTRLVKVILSAKAIAISPQEIENYIAQRLNCECQIIYDSIDE